MADPITPSDLVAWLREFARTDRRTMLCAAISQLNFGVMFLPVVLQVDELIRLFLTIHEHAPDLPSLRAQDL